MGILEDHPRAGRPKTITVDKEAATLVERLFAEVSERYVRLGSHTAVRSLREGHAGHLDQRNKDPKPFVWTADADQILGKIAVVDGW